MLKEIGILKSSGIVFSVLLPLAAGAQAETYKAHLTGINESKLGSKPEGDATFKVVGDNLEVHITMRGVPRDIEHWEHFHGFPDGRDATCVTPEMDANHDSFIDLGETEAVSGTTMVPFNDRPEEMKIPNLSLIHI